MGCMADYDEKHDPKAKQCFCIECCTEEKKCKHKLIECFSVDEEGNEEFMGYTCIKCGEYQKSTGDFQ